MERVYVISPRSYRAGKIDYESLLNEQQLKVVFGAEGPSLVLAGAGSGKTRTLVYRIAYLFERGVPPGRIMLVTFTNKAAREMLARVEAITGRPSAHLWGGTFHHVGNRFLRRFAKLLGIPPNYSILDREDVKDLLSIVMGDLGYKSSKFMFPSADVISNIISYATNTLSGIEHAVSKKAPFLATYLEDIEKIHREYRLRKEKLALMDYDDLLYRWYELLMEREEARAWAEDTFLYILVDEYQDTNRLQAEILKLMRKRNRNILVVGDDAQAIYSFRGATVENILRFTQDFPGAKVFKLEVNYRSTPEILKLANFVIESIGEKIPKTLIPIRRGGEKPVIVRVENDFDEAEFVAHRILELCDQGLKLSEIGVLFRSERDSYVLQQVLVARGIPFVVRGGLRFVEKAHIKDVLAFLRAMSNSKDQVAWVRFLKLFPGVGTATAQKVWRKVSEVEGGKQVAQVLKRFPATGRARRGLRIASEIAERCFQLLPSKTASAILCFLRGFYAEYLMFTYPNAQERAKDIEQLSRIAEKHKTVFDFLNNLAMFEEVYGETVLEEAEPERDLLVLSTVHQAKGLEWKVVFVIHLVDGRFPLLMRDTDLNEEWRLFYVAITRAKDELYLVAPAAREGSKTLAIVKPSRFVEGIPDELCDEWKAVRKEATRSDET